ncbi:MAG: hypothetical protein ACE5E1_08780 [Phycisphaerae bacterium]
MKRICILVVAALTGTALLTSPLAAKESSTRPRPRRPGSKLRLSEAQKVDVHKRLDANGRPIVRSRPRRLTPRHAGGAGSSATGAVGTSTRIRSGAAGRSMFAVQRPQRRRPVRAASGAAAQSSAQAGRTQTKPLSAEQSAEIDRRFDQTETTSGRPPRTVRLSSSSSHTASGARTAETAPPDRARAGAAVLLAAAPPLDEWERYVARVAEHYAFTEAQTAKAHFILKSLRHRAQQYRLGRVSLFNDAEQIQDKQARTLRLATLNRPIDSIFHELKRRLENLPTLTQKLRAGPMPAKRR